MTDFLLLFVLKRKDERLGKRIAFIEEIMGCCYLSCYNLRSLFAIADRRQTKRVYAVLDEIVYDTFGSSLRKVFVVLVCTAEITMRCQFDGDMRILVEQDDQTVECYARTVQQGCRVKLIENVTDKYWVFNACEWKLKRVFFADTAGVNTEFFFMMKITLAGSQEDIVDVGFYFLLERAIAANTQFEICAVVANHIHKTFRQFIAVFLIDPALNRLYDLRMFERHNVVPASGITSVCGKITTVVKPFEGHPEVVAIGVHRVFEVFECPNSQAVANTFNDVQPTHADMSVAGEIEVSVWAKRREHFVARRVDRMTNIFYTAKSMLCDGNTPDVESALSARHVACKV